MDHACMIGVIAIPVAIGWALTRLGEKNSKHVDELNQVALKVVDHTERVRDCRRLSSLSADRTR